MIAYPKKRERAAWQYFKILECCNHFAKVREDDGSTAGKLQVCDNKPSILEKYFFVYALKKYLPGVSVDGGNSEERCRR